MRTEYLIAAVLIALSLVTGWTLRGCTEKPAAEVRTERDTITLRPDTVRITKHATRIVRIEVPTPTADTPDAREYVRASFDTTISAGVDVLRPGSATRADLVADVFASYDEATREFDLRFSPLPITIPDSTRIIRETVTECPPETWYESALRYALYGLAAVGVVSIATQAAR